MPQMVKVSKGFMMSEENSLSNGAILTLHGLRTVTKLKGNIQGKREISVPFSCPHKLKIISTYDENPRTVFHKVNDIYKNDNMPLYVKTNRELSRFKVKVKQREILKAEGVDMTKQGKTKGIIMTRLHFSRKRGKYKKQKFSLPLDTVGNFTPCLPLDYKYELFFVKDIAHSYYLPLCVKFMTEQGEHTEYGPRLGEIQFTEVVTKQIVLATSVLGGVKYAITFPRSLPVTVQVSQGMLDGNREYSRIVKTVHEKVDLKVVEDMLNADPGVGFCLGTVYDVSKHRERSAIPIVSRPPLPPPIPPRADRNPKQTEPASVLINENECQWDEVGTSEVSEPQPQGSRQSQIYSYAELLPLRSAFGSSWIGIKDFKLDVRPAVKPRQKRVSDNPQKLCHEATGNHYVNGAKKIETCLPVNPLESTSNKGNDSTKFTCTAEEVNDSESKYKYMLSDSKSKCKSLLKEDIIKTGNGKDVKASIIPNNYDYPRKPHKPPILPDSRSYSYKPLGISSELCKPPLPPKPNCISPHNKKRNKATNEVSYDNEDTKQISADAEALAADKSPSNRMIDCNAGTLSDSGISQATKETNK